MNERIEQLAKESGIMNYTKIFVPEFEKFAKLIAKEFGNIVLHFNYADEGVAVANKHFGVEK